MTNERFSDKLIVKDSKTYDNPVSDASRRFEIDEIFRRLWPFVPSSTSDADAGYHDVLITKPGPSG